MKHVEVTLSLDLTKAVANLAHYNFHAVESKLPLNTFHGRKYKGDHSLNYIKGGNMKMYTVITGQCFLADVPWTN